MVSAARHAACARRAARYGTRQWRPGRNSREGGNMALAGNVRGVMLRNDGDMLRRRGVGMEAGLR